MNAKDLLDLDKMRELDNNVCCSRPRVKDVNFHRWDWSNLKKRLCPRCGYSLNLLENTYHCASCNFQILETRVKNILELNS